MTAPATDERSMAAIRAYVWAGNRLWTVDFDKVVANTGKDDYHIYEARAHAGPEQRKTTIWSMSRVAMLAHGVDQMAALAWYCRHFRKNAEGILSSDVHHVFLDEDDMEGYLPPKSGHAGDLVEREIDALLFEVAVRKAGARPEPLPLPSAWPIHGRFLQGLVPRAYPAIRAFHDLYVAAMNRGMVATNTDELWSAGVYALSLLSAERISQAIAVEAAPDSAPRQPSQPPTRFEPIELIGGGGYGDVWRCKDNQLQRDVAIKFLRPTQGLSTALDHARALARAQHPNVVTVHQVEILPFPGEEFGGMAVDAIVMELLDGETLDQRLNGSPFSAGEVHSITGQILDAVEHIHARGLAHGDLHAGNIVIHGARVKVIDILYLTGETLALLGTSSIDQRLRRDLLGTARLVSDIVCYSAVRDGVQEGLRQALVSAGSVSEQRAVLKEFLEAVEETNDEDENPTESLGYVDAGPEDSSADLSVLKAIGDVALEIGSTLIEVSEVVRRLVGVVPGNALQESLEVLDEDMHIEAARSFDGIDHVTLTRRGFETFAEHFWPDYEQVVEKVAHVAGSAEENSSIAIAQHLKVPQLGVDFALEALAARGLLKTTREGDGNLFVHNVSAKLRRMVQGKRPALANAADRGSPEGSPLADIDEEERD